MNKQKHNQQVISLQNKTSESSKLSDFLAEYISSNSIPDVIHHDLRLAAEEAFVNIASYAYAKEDQQTVTIELSHTSNEISITFIDTGIAFNPLIDPAESKGTDDFCEGGMGIHLIKSLTDQQKYNRIKQRNVFTVTKNYSKRYTK